MDVNFMKMHNPNNPAPKFAGKSRLGRYSDSVLELDDNIGRIMDVIRAEVPNTIVIVTADNGAWQDAYPDGGTSPFRGENGSAFEAGWRVPGLMWWPGHIPAGVKYDEMMSHIDSWATLASMVGLQPPPHDWVDNCAQRETAPLAKGLPNGGGAVGCFTVLIVAMCFPVAWPSIGPERAISRARLHSVGRTEARNEHPLA